VQGHTVPCCVANTQLLGTSKQLLNQKILQLKYIENLEVSEVIKFMYECTNSQLPATFNNYFKLITAVHP